MEILKYIEKYNLKLFFTLRLKKSMILPEHCKIYFEIKTVLNQNLQLSAVFQISDILYLVIVEMN